MGGFVREIDGVNNTCILLFDTYDEDSRRLHESFRLAGYSYPVAVIEDDGFLPEGVISVYGYFLGDMEHSAYGIGKPRYFNEITVPEYWEISGTNSRGAVHDLSHERGRIFYAEPHHKRLVKIVDWYDERGVVRSSDHYNRYGVLYARTIFNQKGQKVNKTYFSAENKEIIIENYVTKDIILNCGEKVEIFNSRTEFVLYFLKQAGFEQKRIYFNSLSFPFFVSQSMPPEEKKDILFWQEPVGNEIPGNMKIILKGESTRTEKIYVQKRAAYGRLIELGANPDIVKPFGFVYSFARENSFGRNVLICTNSDRIEQCEKIVSAMPEFKFYIAALTEMSSKLMSMEQHENVVLYPGVKMDVLDELFMSCDFYFDINHESEIVSAVQKAFLHNQLIYAFRETAHNTEYTAKENIFAAAECDRMLQEIKKTAEDDKIRAEKLKQQKEAALAVRAEDFNP